MLAEAHEYGYHNDPKIENTVELVEKQMLIQKKSLLFNECISKKVRVTDDILKKAMNRLDTKFELEYIIFVTKEDMKLLLGSDTVLKNSKEFNNAVEKSKKYPDVYHIKISWDWLSAKFVDLRDDIYHLEQGEISHPLYGFDGIIIFCVNSKIRNEVNKSENENSKKYIHNRLKFIEEQKLAARFDKKLYNAAKININNEAAENIWELIRLADKKHVFDPLIFKDYKDKIIVSYKVDSSIINISVSEFVEYYNNRMIKKAISTKGLLYYYLRDIAWEDHAVNYAYELGLNKDEEFVIERKLYKNRLIIKSLIKDRMKNELNITEDELQKRYEIDKERFNRGVYSKMSILYFSSLKNALSGRKYLNENHSKKLDKITLNNAELNGLIKVEFNKKLHHESKELPDHVIDRIFQVGDNTILPPTKLNDSTYTVIIKEGKIGNRYIPYYSVKEILKNKLYNNKFKKAKSLLYEMLCKKYKVETHLKALAIGPTVNP